jgi:hypothetical protein
MKMPDGLAVVGVFIEVTRNTNFKKDKTANVQPSKHKKILIIHMH